MHTMVSGLLCHAAGQLKVLKYTLMNLDARENPAPTKQYLGELDGDTGDEYDAGEAVYRKISECVQHYDSIFEFVNRVEDTFSFVIFSQFLASTIVICISCLQMSKESMTSISFFNSTLFCIAMLNEIFVFCYYGTILFEDVSIF
ncbi:unnamed protein product [Acanthoscelides obtectus]|uniref:Uncharacterized protein n=1 Tax=Acanthoscelides obtectus TaxID=200917 RepID=A0A9P0JZG7_ACAOB|nr:unnamed protein product [Acanthoscelides obtectus]CAK1631591.1 Odorant receptor Or1 [Acanthoscelides obtectus]